MHAFKVIRVFTCSCILLSFRLTFAADPAESEYTTEAAEEIVIEADSIRMEGKLLPENLVRHTPDFTVGEILEIIPGVSSIRTAQGAPEPVLRGMAGERVRTQVGAVPVFGACPARMDPPVVYLLPQTSSSVRLDLGADSISAGPAGIGGRIRVRPDWEPDGKTDPFGTDGTFAFDSNGLRSRLGASAHSSWDTWEGRVGIDLARGENFRSGGGSEVPGGHEHVGSSLSLAFRPRDDQRVFASVSHVRETDVDHPALPMDNDLTDFWVANTGYRLDREGVLSRLEIEAGLSWVDHNMSNRKKPNRTQVEAWTPSVSRTGAASVHMVFNLTSSSELTTGFDFYHLHRDAERTRQMVSSGATFHDHIWPEASEWVAGASAEWKWLIGSSWLLNLGGRLDVWGSTAGALSDPSLQNLTIGEQFVRLYGEGADTDSHLGLLGGARLMLTWLAAEKLTVSLEGAWAGRAPSVTERFFAFAPAPGGYQVGNPILKPEKKTSLEAGLKWQYQYLDIDVAGFVYHIDDFILREVVEQRDVNGDGSEDQVFGFSNSVALFAGAEWQCRLKPLPWLFFPLSLSTVYGRNLADDRYLEGIPPLQGRAALRIEREDKVPWWVELRTTVTAAQTFIDPGVGESVSPAWTILDFHAGVEPFSWLRLEVGVRNLTDADYHFHLSRAVLMAAGDLPPGTRLPAPGVSAYLVASGRY